MRRDHAVADSLGHELGSGREMCGVGGGASLGRRGATRLKEDEARFGGESNGTRRRTEPSETEQGGIREAAQLTGIHPVGRVTRRLSRGGSEISLWSSWLNHRPQSYEKTASM